MTRDGGHLSERSARIFAEIILRKQIIAAARSLAAGGQVIGCVIASQSLSAGGAVLRMPARRRHCSGGACTYMALATRVAVLTAALHLSPRVDRYSLRKEAGEVASTRGGAEEEAAIGASSRPGV